tara:strand:- start:596 stop:865 length:270 start_codon:yes stop_codon:yes gene_type:complete
MVLGLIILLVLVGFISIKLGKSLPEELSLLPLIIMLGLDAMCIFGFKEFLGMENKLIAFSIITATILKVIVFVLMMPKENIFSSTPKRF